MDGKSMVRGMASILLGYFKLLRRKACFGILVMLTCACLGSIRGAMKESREPFIGVTQEDMEMSDRRGKEVPDLTGIIPLAARQNRWRNFSYAIIYAGRGFVVYCMLMAVYFCKIYRKKRRILC